MTQKTRIHYGLHSPHLDKRRRSGEPLRLERLRVRRRPSLEDLRRGDRLPGERRRSRDLSKDLSRLRGLTFLLRFRERERDREYDRAFRRVAFRGGDSERERLRGLSRLREVSRLRGLLRLPLFLDLDDWDWDGEGERALRFLQPTSTA